MALLSLADVPELPSMLEGNADPHAVIREIRERYPLARTAMGLTLALRYRHLELVMSDATRQIETETTVMQGITAGPIFDFIKASMLFANGDEHRRRRAPVSRTFAFKLMEAMRSKAAALAEELIAARIGTGPIDFVDEIAAQIPARIIAEILGIPRSDLPIFMNWIADTGESLGFIGAGRREQIEKSLVEFNAYVGKLLADRRAEPKGDFLSDYVEATARDSEMSEIEIRTQIIGLILAGSDTTRNTLCMTLAHLLRHEDQWRAFCADPDELKRGVVSEGLRFEPVVSAIPRIAAEDLDIDGYRVPRGVPIALSLMSVLRDPEQYAEPDRFNIHRTDHPRWHPIFGAGAHRCVGEALARAELEETMVVIARLAPNTRLAGDFPRLTPSGVRQVGQMRVEFIP